MKPRTVTSIAARVSTGGRHACRRTPGSQVSGNRERRAPRFPARSRDRMHQPLVDVELLAGEANCSGSASGSDAREAAGSSIVSGRNQVVVGGQCACTCQPGSMVASASTGARRRQRLRLEARRLLRPRICALRRRDARTGSARPASRARRVTHVCARRAARPERRAVG
jgi:hypothetical protein